MTMQNRNIEFIDNKIECYVNAILKQSNLNKIKFIIKPYDEFARKIKDLALSKSSNIQISAEHNDTNNISNEVEKKSFNDADVVVVHSNDGCALSKELLDISYLTNVHIIAPITDWYYKNKPLFIISIPKSGTHLLNNLVEILGYETGIVYDTFPELGKWYCLEYSNSHTCAKDFFVDSARRAPYGNRLHPFSTTPSIFIYRNPLDILISEANYYHKEGKTTFAGYLSNLDFNQRIERLIDDPWMLGSLSERVGNYVAWLEFQNVIPISFEEIIGEKGGGDDEIQENLIWSLLLKLQIPGSPSIIANKIFNPDSPTFHKGQVGAYKNQLPPNILERLKSSDQGFMRAFGYEVDSESIYSTKIDEFRKRPLALSNIDNVAITIEYNYLSFNIVQYKYWIYAIPQKLGSSFNLHEISEETLSLLIRSKNLSQLKARLVAGNLFIFILGFLQRLRVLSILNIKSLTKKKHYINVVNKVLDKILLFIK